MKLSRLKNNFLLGVFISALYFCAGVLGLKLAVPPGFATAVFPSAGIALAAILIWGRHFSPAIFLGSSLMNCYVTYTSSGVLTTHSMIISVLIGSGAALQALVGDYVVRRYVPRFLTLSHEDNVLKFLALAGPVSCLVSSTFNISVLYFFGIISGSALFYNWAIWYVGDTVGVMVFAPMILALAEKPFTEITNRKRLVVLPSLILFSFSISLFFLSSEQLSNKLKAKMQNESESSAQTILESMHHYTAALAATERFFASSKEVDPDEYHEFVSGFFLYRKSIRVITWNPKITKSERKSFESEGYQIVDVGQNGLQLAQERDLYFPIKYVEPFLGNDVALGYDAYSSSVRREAMERALLEKRATVSGEIQFVPDVITKENVPSVAIYQPVYAKDKTLRGFITCVLRVSDIIGAAIESSSLVGLNYAVYDVTDETPTLLFNHIVDSEKELFADHASLEKNRPRELYIANDISVGGRLWRFELFPSKQYLSTHSDLTAWSMLIGGLFLVILLQSLMMIIVGRAATVQALVDQKTLELSAANEELEELTQLIAQDLAESNLNFRQLAESMPQIVWILNKEGEPTYFNQHWEQYTGCKINQTDWESLVHPEDVAEAKEKHMQALRNKTDFELEYRMRSKEGKYKWFLVRGLRVKDSGGNVIKWFGTSTDIDEYKKAAWDVFQAQQASHQKSVFLANMSHEIRTPINGVVGMAGLLKDTPLNGEQIDCVDNILTSANSLLSVIDDILDFSKIEAGKLSLEVIDFDLEHTVTAAFRTIEFLARRKNLPLLLEFAETPKMVLRGDPGRISQVLINLINNAIKFTHEGEISLKINRVKNNRYRFEVIDSGIGIKENVIEKIFNPFDQADNSTTRKFGGTGLGLSISKTLVELMNGQMGVRSVFGQGSTFWFEIDLPEGQKSIDEFRNKNAPDVHLPERGFRVLLAEDNHINQMIAAKQLEKIGCFCDAVANGKEAIEALRRLNYDMILMDCQMPEMDGYEATRQIRSMKEHFSNIPIIAMTANAMKGDREKCLEAGMDDYISKPISIEDLLAVVEAWAAKTSAKAV